MEKKRLKKILDVRNLCFAYYKKPLCINDASFVVYENEKVLLLGVGESGKTTMIKALSSFDETYIGQIFYNGKDLKKYNDNEKRFSVLFSEPVLLNSTINKNIDYLCEVEGIEKFSQEKKKELLDKFLINKQLDEKIKKLTLCEKRKLAMLRAWIKKPEVLFLDDQFVGLDEKEVDDIKLLYKLFFNEKLVVIAVAENKTIKDNYESFKDLRFNKIVYLSFSKAYEYDSYDEFFEKKTNFDVLSFSNEYEILSGYVARQDGSYFYVGENDVMLKFDKMFYDKLSMMSLVDNETEDAFLCFEKNQSFDQDNNAEFNKRLKNKTLWLFSAVDRSRVI